MNKEDEFISPFNGIIIEILKTGSVFSGSLKSKLKGSRKEGSQEAGKKLKPFGLALNACGEKEGTWEGKGTGEFFKN